MTSQRESGIVAVYVLFESDEEARRIGRLMIERRLAACVNLLGPCHSIYRWQDVIEETAEVAAIFKTTSDGAGALTTAIRAEHNYDVPAISVLPVIATQADYASWVGENVD